MACSRSRAENLSEEAVGENAAGDCLRNRCLKEALVPRQLLL